MNGDVPTLDFDNKKEYVYEWREKNMNDSMSFSLDEVKEMTLYGEIDRVNEVANTQPIDTLGIFEGLERSASSLSASGNTLDQSIAMISAANSVVQDPASIGTAFKTKFLQDCLYVQKCA